MPDYVRIYARQEYMTPGAAETVAIIEETVRPGEATWLLDLASGKGEAAATLASHHACRILCIEPYDPFVHYSTAKFWHFNLRDLVSLVRANGRKMPVRDGVMDAAYCIGAPSIVGLEPALREMARVVKPGGWVIASDIIWREKAGELGEDWGWLAEAAQTTAEEYTTAMEASGLTVERVNVHDRKVWDEYWKPMLAVADEAKRPSELGGADIFFADEIESNIDLERRGVERWLDYATFVARRP